MSEQELDIVVPDDKHIALPPEVNQNTVKARIDELISAGVSTEIDEPEHVESNPPPAKDESLKESSVDDEIASLEADETDPEADQEQDQEQDQETEPVETLDAKSLAEKLDVTVEEIYSMKFPYGENGDAITLGELKDAGIRARTIDEEVETLADQRNSFTNDQMKSRSELQNIVSMLPDGIPPELVQAANFQRQQAVQRERVSLLETLPDWQDSAVEEIARGAISDNLKQYGFQQIEIDNMLDHRLVKLMHDFTRMRQKIVKPAAEVQKMKKAARGRRVSKSSRGQKQVSTANQQRRTDLKGAINTLLPRG